MVRRDVVRLVTAGTLTEDTLLDARRNNYLAAIARARSSSEAMLFALAWIDISTAEFRLTECDRAGLAAELARLEPSEIIVSDALYGDGEIGAWLRSLPAVMPLTRDLFDGATAERRLADYFHVATTEAFGTFSRLELTAAAACVTYVERTQLGKRPPLSPPAREAAGRILQIDAATRGNLELVRTLAGERRGSLLAAIDRTVTAAGCAAAGAAPLRAAHRTRQDRARGSTRSRPSWATPPRAMRCAMPSTPRPISPARSRGWWSAAAARAILPAFATGSPRRPHSPR